MPGMERVLHRTVGGVSCSFISPSVLQGSIE